MQAMIHPPRSTREQVPLGIDDDLIFTGDHIAYFYESDQEFERAFGFLDAGLRGDDHCIIFGIPEDVDRALKALQKHGWNAKTLMDSGRLSALAPAATCDETLERVSQHFEKVLASGARFIRFIGNAAVGRAGWPVEDEFYKLEATVSEATLNLPCVAICMFDLRAQSAQTLMKAAFEGHPVTLHRNCVRENPYYVPRAAAAL
jgi:hypothetical protein